MPVHDSEARYGAPQHVVDVIDGLHRLSREQGCISVGDVIDTLGTRSYGPILIVPALIEITPLGGLPGVPSFLAFVAALFAVQMLLGRRHVWVPGFIERRTLGADRLHAASHRLMPIARRLDRLFHGRLRALTRGLFVRLAALLVLGLCATVPPLELLPFASSAPMIGIALVGLALLVHDGALMLVALGLGGGAVLWAAASLVGGG